VTENFETVFDVSYQKANNNPDLNHSDFLLPSHRSVITETASSQAFKTVFLRLKRQNINPYSRLDEIYPHLRTVFSTKLKGGGVVL
jgi:hypothetical protein